MSTSAPTAPIDICNLALGHLASGPIASIENPTTPLEEDFALWYDHIRQLCLREYMWNCAKTYRELARSGDGVDGWEDAYIMPVDCLRVNSLGEPPPCDLKAECFDIQGRTIYANQGDTLKLRYNKDLTDVTMFDAGFRNYFALRLAIKLAFKVTKKKSTGEYLEAQLKLEEPKAIQVDGQEKPPMRVQTSKYLAARRRGGAAPTYDNRYVRFD